MSGSWPTRTPVCTDITAMKRAKTCARGMNSSVDEPSATTSGMASVAPSTVAVKLSCRRTQPLGRPVVPDV